MKVNMSLSCSNSGAVVIHAGDSVDLPWRFREILVVGSDGEAISDIKRCNKKIIGAITNEEFSNRFWSRIKSR